MQNELFAVRRRNARTTRHGHRPHGGCAVTSSGVTMTRSNIHHTHSTGKPVPCLSTAAELTRPRECRTEDQAGHLAGHDGGQAGESPTKTPSKSPAMNPRMNPAANPAQNPQATAVRAGFTAIRAGSASASSSANPSGDRWLNRGQIGIDTERYQPSELLSQQEIADWMGCSAKSARSWINGHKIEAADVPGRTRRYRAGDIRRVILKPRSSQGDD